MMGVSVENYSQGKYPALTPVKIGWSTTQLMECVYMSHLSFLCEAMRCEGYWYCLGVHWHRGWVANHGAEVTAWFLSGCMSGIHSM